MVDALRLSTLRFYKMAVALEKARTARPTADKLLSNIFVSPGGAYFWFSWTK